jgi:hypothetical protein
MQSGRAVSDEELANGEVLSEDALDRIQRAAFLYFVETTNPANGLIADTSRNAASR